MKIQTTIRQAVIRNDGTSSVNERTTITVTGDNPSFERGECVGALDVASHEFKEAKALNGTRPL